MNVYLGSSVAVYLVCMGLLVSLWMFGVNAKMHDLRDEIEKLRKQVER